MLRLLLNAVLFFEIFTFLRKIAEEKPKDPPTEKEDEHNDASP